MKRRSWVVLLGVAALAASIVAPSVQAAGSAPAHGKASASGYVAGRYIVTFVDDPVASYTGYKAGYPATKPSAGKHVNPNSAAVKKWQGYLTAQHDAALARVGAAKIYDYTVTNNGFAARLTARQAEKLARMTGVVALELDRLAHPDTTLSPHFLGLDAAGGHLGPASGTSAQAGAGIVVGVIDTGIWPENPSFAGHTGIPIPADWHGACIAGQNLGHLDLQRQDHRRPLLLRGLRPEEHQQGRLQVARVTAPGTARTPRRRPPATTASR